MMEEACRPADVLLPLLLLCKDVDWQAVQHLLYRHLHFSKPSTVHALHCHLVREELRQNFPGRLTRTITLHDKTLALMYITPKVLSYTTNLQQFSADGVPLCASTLRTLRVQAAKSLRKLDVLLCPEDGDGAVKLCEVAWFSALQELSISTIWSTDSSSFPIGQAPGVQMVHLDQLCVTTLKYPPVPEFLGFLSRCSFPQLRSLTLDFPVPDGDGVLGAAIDRAQLLEPLFERIGAHLTSLSLNMSCLSVVPISERLLPHLLNLQQLHIIAGPPPIQLLDTIPCSPVTINFNLFADLDEVNKQDPASALAWLEQLEQRELPDHLRVFVRLKGTPTLPFHWLSLCDTTPTLAGKLLCRSLKLPDRQITLQDEDGRTLVLTDRI
ncbi:hypothetical protein CALCODRAFT_557939 [Calocera cornea HHB12733]|uniref:F-box domain-containing protein n=1 Tax=Calocera cornea HHB12733 TaxID=1353952 RepID=A0A165DER2_9BASI|nr:hypothetical protein CALCODRAFT_557939 [Calocera cornea HHB12733]